MRLVLINVVFHKSAADFHIQVFVLGKLDCFLEKMNNINYLPRIMNKSKDLGQDFSHSLSLHFFRNTRVSESYGLTFHFVEDLGFGSFVVDNEPALQRFMFNDQSLGGEVHEWEEWISCNQRTTKSANYRKFAELCKL